MLVRKKDVDSWMLKGTSLHNCFIRALFFDDILFLPEAQPRYIILFDPITYGIADQYQRN
jgi:hypothetical protein